MAQYTQLELGHADEFNEEIIFMTQIDSSKYDAIDLTGVKPDVIAEVNRKMVGIEALLKKVILGDFIFRLCDSGGVEVHFLVHCYDKKSRPIVANDGKKYRRYLDLYQLSADGNEVINICQILLLHNKFPLRYEMRRVGIKVGKHIKTEHIGAMERYRKLDQRYGASSFLHRMSRYADPSWEDRTQYVLYHYLFAIHEMVNCPERFVESGDGARRVLEGVSEIEKLRPVIKPTHTSGSPSAADGDRIIQCPYWTVRGHYRTLKSGKKVWVRPYAKGKERNNPDQIVAKTYNIG